MTDRIQIILRSMNISPSRFADEIDVQRSSVSHILSGRNKPSLDFVTKILSSYPEINADWLLFGKGTIFRKPDKSVEEKNEEVKAVEKKKVDETSSPVYKYEKHHKNLNLTAKKVVEPISQDEQIIEKIILFFPNNTFKVYKSSE